MLKAGVSLVDISPKEGITLSGYPHCPRPNKGIHDPLYAACLYLDNGKKRLAFVSLDLLYIGKKHVKAVREKFPDVEIMFCASHTHSGPVFSTVHNDGGATYDEQYNTETVCKLQKLIEDAIAGVFDAKIGIDTGSCGAEQGIGGNRRIKGGPADTSVNIIAVKDNCGEVKAVLLNYSLHPTYLHAENELVSADYPGFIRRYFGFAYPKAVFLFAQGTSGNQSSRYHRVGQDFEEAARAGTTIAVEGFHVVENMSFTDDVDLSAKSVEIDLPYKHFPSEEQALKLVKTAQENFEKSKGGDYIPMRNAELALFGAENQLSYAKLFAGGFSSPELPCELQFITIGDNLIVSVQGEIFVEYGLAVKQSSPFKNTFMFSVSNGALPGYLYTPQAGAEGGYETGTSIFSDLAAETILSKIKEVLNV